MACFDPRIDEKLFFAKGLVSTSVHLVGAGEFEPSSVFCVCALICVIVIANEISPSSLNYE